MIIPDDLSIPQELLRAPRPPRQPQLPLVPTNTADNRWQPPTELPDLRRAGIIALDTETKDDGLADDRGAAWPWKGGYICGVSVAWREGEKLCSRYFPLRHPDSANFNQAQFFQ